MNSFSIANIEKLLMTKAFGRKMQFSHSLVSTNIRAKELAKLRDTPEGFVVIANAQTGAKGRWNRHWSSPEGGLWFSVILRPTANPSELGLLPLLAGLAVCEAIAALGLRAQLRWPNDVLIGCKKVCGILCETSIIGDEVLHAVVGVGINANFHATSLRGVDCATTLLDELGHSVDCASLLAGILLRMENYYRARDRDAMVNKAAALTETLGQHVTLQSSNHPLEGRAVGLDENGALIVEIDNGQLRHVTSLEVTRLLPAIGVSG